MPPPATTGIGMPGVGTGLMRRSPRNLESPGRLEPLSAEGIRVSTQLDDFRKEGKMKKSSFAFSIALLVFAAPCSSASTHCEVANM